MFVNRTSPSYPFLTVVTLMGEEGGMTGMGFFTVDKSAFIAIITTAISYYFVLRGLA